MTDDTEPSERPALVVIHGGEPAADELAALVVALAPVAEESTAARRRAPRWADRRALLRRPLEHGPGRWSVGARPSR